MADTVTNATQLQDMFMAKRYIERLGLSLKLVPLGTREDAPSSSGKTVRWNVLANPIDNGAPAEGADPTGYNLTATSVEATMVEEGDFINLTRFFDMTARTGTRAEYVDAVAYQAALVLDTRTVTELANATTVIAAAPATLQLGTDAVETLESNNARFHPATPGGNYYCWVLTPKAAYTIIAEGSLVWGQAKDNDLREALVTPLRETPPTAAIHNYILKTSTNLGAVSTDDLTYMIAKDFFGVVSIGGSLMQPRVIVTTPEQSYHKPIRNAGTIGWVAWFAAKIIDNNRGVEIVTNQ